MKIVAILTLVALVLLVGIEIQNLIEVRSWSASQRSDVNEFRGQLATITAAMKTPAEPRFEYITVAIPDAVSDETMNRLGQPLRNLTHGPCPAVRDRRSLYGQGLGG